MIRLKEEQRDISELKGIIISKDHENDPIVIVKSSVKGLRFTDNMKAIIDQDSKTPGIHYIYVKRTKCKMFVTADRYDMVTLDIPLMEEKERILFFVDPEEEEPTKTDNTVGFKIDTEPSGAEFSFIGPVKTIFKTPNVEERPVGRYQLRITKNEYRDTIVSIIISEKNTEKMVKLTPKFGYVKIEDIRSGEILIFNGVKYEQNTFVPVKCDASVYSVSFSGTTLRNSKKSLPRPKYFSVLPSHTEDDPLIIAGSQFFEKGVFVFSADAAGAITVKNIVTKQEVRRVTQQKKIAIPEIEPGDYTLEYTHPDLGRRVISFFIDPGEKKQLSLDILPSYQKTMMYAFIPGAAQLYKQQTIAGYGFISGFTVGAAASLYYHFAVQKDQKQYDDAVANYNAAANIADIQKYRTEVETVYPALKDEKNMRILSVALTGGIYIWNVVHAFIAEPSYGYHDDAVAFKSFYDDRSKTLSFGIQAKF